jgi:hypothetical protein
MSADCGTEHFKGYLHRHPGGPDYIHVVMRAGDGPFDGEAPLGNLSLAEITELAGLAGQAWPHGPGVEVRYVIECRPRDAAPGAWRAMWSAAAAEEEDSGGGVSEQFAVIAYAGFTSDPGNLEWRLARRTTLTADEPITPDGAS